jgi:hypothetical protein
MSLGAFQPGRAGGVCRHERGTACRARLPTSGRRRGTAIPGAPRRRTEQGAKRHHGDQDRCRGPTARLPWLSDSAHRRHRPVRQRRPATVPRVPDLPEPQWSQRNPGSARLTPRAQGGRPSQPAIHRLTSTDPTVGGQVVSTPVPPPVAVAGPSRPVELPAARSAASEGH